MISAILIAIFALSVASNNRLCNYQRVCRLYDASFDIDCGMIHDIKTACSNETLTAIGRRYNVKLNESKCHYTCCWTDGDSCSYPFGPAVNIQSYWWEP